MNLCQVNRALILKADRALARLIQTDRSRRGYPE